MGALHFSGTPNEVYPELIHAIAGHGAEVGPRGTRTKEWSPVVIELERPWERLVTSYGRPVNVAFALAEFLWILQGRRDVAMLEFYNSQIKQFSDNGTTFNAPYGYRLRRAHGFDQIEDVIHTLCDDPASRRATMVLWHPDDSGWKVHIDNPDDMVEMVRRQTKDRACNVMAHLMLRDTELKWMQVVRSNDAILGVPYNFMQFTLLQEYISRRLQAGIGNFTYIADSMHLYIDGGYYPVDAIENVRHFDIYNYMDAPPFMEVREEVIEDVASVEESIRTGAQPTGFDNSFWGQALRLWSAHRQYREGNNANTLAILGDMGTVYGAAQLRFYWTQRWHKNPMYTRQVIVDHYPEEVVEWITSGK